MKLNKKANQCTLQVKWMSLAAIVVAIMLMVRRLPIDQGIAQLEEWVAALGIFAPIAFGLIYVLATVLFIPGSALTLAGGVIFGLASGTIIVSLSSTTGAALALLIARYFARDRFAKKVEQYPKFKAIDKAIGKGGWKIVAMLRLSPAVPFNLQNYLYGLTAIRFWPCVLTSWIAMMPGTFMYVYLGYIARQGAQAAAGAGGAGNAVKWIMTIVGLLATVAVTVYVTKIAARAMKEHTQIDDVTDDTPHSNQDQSDDSQPPAPEKGWPMGTSITALLAIVLLTVAACAQFVQIGPPQAQLTEAYQEKADGPVFDHHVFDELLKAHVEDNGWIDYAGLNKQSDKLNAYLSTIVHAPFDQMGRSEKLVLLINAYNAFTLRLILDYWDGGKLTSIKDIPKARRWDDVRWNVGGHTWSLNDIEHKQIRPKFSEPRIHFALVCAAVGCPIMRNEAYQADQLDEQLEDQMCYSHRHARWLRYDLDKHQVQLTSLYKWYGGDFKQVAGSVLNFAARYSPQLKASLDAGVRPSVRYLDYSWKLNDKRNKK